MFTTTKQLDTFKDVAAALREADGMRLLGEVQKIDHSWHDMHSTPIGVCACGAIALVAGLEVARAWSDHLFYATYPVLAREVVHPDLPAGGEDEEDEYVADLVSVLSSLNSRSNWTWTRIADWLEGLPEPEEKPLEYTDEVVGTEWNS